MEEDSDTHSSDTRSTDPLIGLTLDEKYLIKEFLGGGGMGAVYRGTHLLMEREVAIKILHSHLASGKEKEEFLARFQREARTASKLNHPGAVTIHDFGIASDLPYIVMEFNSGITLGSLIKTRGALKLSTVVQVMDAICGALDAAHALGIVHRDLKPDNVMVNRSSDGKPLIQVLDFGIAKIASQAAEDSMTMTGILVGTPYYMSPEQIRCETLDARSDVYSLGIMLHQMLCGELPFTAKSSPEVLMMHLSEQPPLVPLKEPNDAIQSVVLKSLQKKPEDRQQSVLELNQELRDAVTIGKSPKKSRATKSSKASSTKKNGESGKSIIKSALDVLSIANGRRSNVVGNVIKILVPLAVLATVYLSSKGRLTIGPAQPAQALLENETSNKPEPEPMQIQESEQISPTPTVHPESETEAFKRETGAVRILWNRLRSKREEIRSVLNSIEQEVERLEDKLFSASASTDLKASREELFAKKIELDAQAMQWRLHEQNIFAPSSIAEIEALEADAKRNFEGTNYEQSKAIFTEIKAKLGRLLVTQNQLLAFADASVDSQKSERRLEQLAIARKANIKDFSSGTELKRKEIDSLVHDGLFAEAAQKYRTLQRRLDEKIENMPEPKPKRIARKKSPRQVKPKIKPRAKPRISAEERRRMAEIARAERELEESDRKAAVIRREMEEAQRRTENLETGIKILQSIGSIFD